MRLKYKKIILIVTMSTMGIGLLTLSLSNTPAKSVSSKKTEQTIANKNKSNDSDKKEEKTAAGEAAIADGKTDDGTLQENAYPGVNALIQKYLDARAKMDLDTIKGIVSKTNQITLDVLQKEAEYIEGYQNISCYTLKGPEEGSFIVYIYEEVKLVGIDTLAPGLVSVYVCSDEDGKLYLNFGQIDDSTKDEIEATYQDAKVISLIDSVNIKLEEAITSDPALQNFKKNMEKAQQEAAKSDTSSKAKDSAKSSDKK